MALSHAFNADKQKYLVALNLSGTNSAEPPNTTDSPYAPPTAKKAKTMPEAAPEAKVFNRWGLDNDDLPHKRSQQNNQNPRQNQRHDQRQQNPRNQQQNPRNQKQQHTPNPQACWFCLSSPQVETHLVASIGNDVYLALPKGNLVPDHVLIIPIEHHPAIALLPDSTHVEVDKYKDAMLKYFGKKGMSMLVFERNLPTKGTLHGHLQIIPVPNALITKALPQLRSEATALSIPFTEFPHDKSLKEIVGPSPYFAVEIYSAGTKTVLVHMPSEGSKSVPLQFGREWAAKLLGCPERVDWKQCAVSKKEEEAMVSAFKKEFEKFDPSA